MMIFKSTIKVYTACDLTYTCNYNQYVLAIITENGFKISLVFTEIYRGKEIIDILKNCITKEI